MFEFVQHSPTLDAYWRSIILFGRNTASYKFALGKSLLDLSSQEKTFIPLEELAVPFSTHIIDHLAKSDRQGTSSSSRFLEGLKRYSEGAMTREQMIDHTVRLGFVNVIDAFHIVNQGEIPFRIFIDERKKGGITITDEFLAMKETFQSNNLPSEVEARWRLVETAWSLGLTPGLLYVNHDPANNILYVDRYLTSRINVTSGIDALNGYQKGKCFYCFSDISVDDCDVDHFFPIVLARGWNVPNESNLNGI